MKTNSDYHEFYDEAPTFSVALAALQDEGCPEQIVADLLSFRILPTDDGSVDERFPAFADLLSTGLSGRTLSSLALDQICNQFVSWLVEESGEFGADDMFGFSHYEVFENIFEGFFDQEKLSLNSLENFISALETLAHKVIEVQESGSGSEEGVDFPGYFTVLADIFEAIASNANSTLDLKTRCEEFSQTLREKSDSID